MPFSHEGTAGEGDVVGLFRRFVLSALRKHPEWMRPDATELLNSAPDGIVIINTGGEIVFVNSQTEILFGYRREELNGQSVEILIPARFGQAHLKHRVSFFAEPHVRPMGRDLSLFGKRKDGQEFPVEISLSPLRTAGGLYVTATVRDVTDRKRAEEKVKKLNLELAEALRRAELLGTSGELATRMAREIEFCTAALARLLSTLERNPAANTESKELIAQAREEINNITRITSNALALQKQHATWMKS